MISLLRNDQQAAAHYLAIKDDLIHVIERVLTNGGITPTKKRAAVHLSPELKTYLEKLLNDGWLEALIIASPDTLTNQIARLQNAVPQYALPANHKILEYIFIDTNYNRSFDKLAFIEQINVDTCVYCNRNYIYYLKKDQKIKPQIDHFYPKAVYPFLGMSFYNLIPSCQTCNGPDCKHNHDPYTAQEPLIHPYLIDETQFLFTYDVKSTAPLSKMDKSTYEVNLICGYHAHLDIFKLDELYALHADHVAELVTKASLNYSPTYRNYLTRSYQRLGLTDHEINRLITGNYLEKGQLHRRPLAKLYLDIADELGLVEKS